MGGAAGLSGYCATRTVAERNALIATTAKLAELAATKWSVDDRAVLGDDGFEILITSVRGDLSNLAKAAAAPDLARLVLTLTEALAEKTHNGRTVLPVHATPCKACAALAAVEELRL